LASVPLLSSSALPGFLEVALLKSSGTSVFQWLQLHRRHLRTATVRERTGGWPGSLAKRWPGGMIQRRPLWATKIAVKRDPRGVTLHLGERKRPLQQAISEPLADDPEACYTETKPKFRMLCESS